MHKVKPLMILAAIAVVLSLGSVASAAMTLQFDPNDIFNYATSDDTRLNQQGTARAIWGLDRTVLDVNGTGQTGRYYQTYNDGSRMTSSTNPPQVAATAAKDLQSVANILDWTAGWGHQGMNWMQLYLQGPNEGNWGGKVVLRSGTMSPSVNGEFGWRTSLSGATPVFDTELGGDPATNQNAISPDANPAEKLFSVTGDFFLDENGNGVYDAGDSNLVVGQDYTIWFYAKLNNWTYLDDYGNGNGGNPGYIEGTLTATAIPEPASVIVWSLLIGITWAGGAWRHFYRRRRQA